MKNLILKITNYPLNELGCQHVVFVLQYHRMEADVVGEVLLEPVRVFNESRILRDPQLHGPILGGEVQKPQRKRTSRHYANDDERPWALGYRNSPANVIITY